MPKINLSTRYIKNICKIALKEDFYPSGDITSKLIKTNQINKFNLISNQNAILAGINLFKFTFKIIDKKINIKLIKKDGSKVKKGTRIAIIKGNTKSILMAERTALNFLSHLSGIATKTNEFVKKTKKYKTKICCTRKTIPNLRLLQKYAVRIGGGFNHRFNASNEFLIKDNHIASSNIVELITLANKKKQKKIITVEVDNIKQLKEILGLKFQRVLLDNMTPKNIRKAVKLVNNKYETEASGSININNIKKISSTKVNRISIGSLTHSVKAVDLKLET